MLAFFVTGGENMKTNQIYIPKEIIKDKRLTPTTKRVAFHLFHIYGWEKDTILPSRNSLAKKFESKSDTISKAYNLLQEYGYLKINPDNTFNFLLNNCDFTKKDLKNKMLCNLVGDFVVVPKFIIYCNEITAGELLAYIMFFDFYFSLTDKGFQLKKKELHATSVAKYYNVDASRLQKQIRSLKAKGYLDYNAVKTGTSSKYINFKFFYAEQKWIIYNGKTPVENKPTEEKIITKTVVKNEEYEELEKEYVPTEKEIAERNELVNQLNDYRKKEYEYRYINSDIKDQLYWLKKVLKK